MRLFLTSLIFSVAVTGVFVQAGVTTSPQCAKEVKDCENEFIQAINKAHDDTTKSCKAGADLEMCLKIAEQSACTQQKATVDGIRASYKAQIDQTGCATAPVPKPTGCLKDVMTCESNFSTAILNAPNDAPAQCAAGATFMTCLDQKDQLSECAYVKKVIANLRLTYGSQLQAAGCVASVPPTVTKCQGDVIECAIQFTSAIGDAGQNVVAQCSAGKTFTACLNAKDQAPECASVKSVIASLRAQFASQITTQGCRYIVPADSSPADCNQNVKDCENQFVLAVKKAGQDKVAACAAGAMLENCLQTQEQSAACAGKKAAVDAVRQAYTANIDRDGCANAAAPTASPCLADVMKCETTFSAAVKAAPSDIKVQCSAGATLMICLDTVDQRSECASVKSAVANMKKSYTDQIIAAGCPNTALSCENNVKNCETQFVAGVQAAGQDVTKSCAAGTKLENCLAVQEQSTLCAGRGSVIDAVRKSYAAQISADGCASAPKPTAPPCLADVLGCESGFITAQQDAGNDKKAQCNTGNQFLRCLEDNDKRPECVTAKSTIAMLRSQYSGQIQQAGCSIDSSSSSSSTDACTTDLNTCVTQFGNALYKAGNDTSAACLAGQNLEACFKQRETDTNCANNKQSIGDMRKEYQQQIDAKSCSSPEAKACAKALGSCMADYNAKQNGAPIDSKYCDVATTLVNCLNGPTCSPGYQLAKQKTFDFIKSNLDAAKLTCDPFGGSTAVTSSVVFILCMALLARFV